ncbi:ABC transporter substrate-binding protein [Nonomuraea sp. NN258]|uniref:ABC transporter substrate-binding protein n=1 Tax=Nonomuraea antri TaxID=2730852 RepID=UPI001567F68F|nr:ABC transporter substrate-binding protein [Nonomuraea antri]NRQ37381.1 ABC transporter substrate-binding protein [Nonomuraea antri]
MHAPPRTVRPRILRAAAVSAALALSACSAGPAGPAAAPPGEVKLTVMTPAATSEVGTVTWNLPTGEPTTLDPAKAGDYSPSTVQVNLCDSLLRLNADYSAGPGLATAWRSPDPKTLVLDLRKDVTFWNGNPMTAADVVASLTRQRDPAVQSVNAPVLDSVRDITATGPHQVTVRFHRPDRLFTKFLVSGFGAISEAAYMKQAGSAYGTARGGLMCTGPFKLSSWKPGQSITAVRNDRYWDAALRPKAAALTFTFITDANTLTSALLSGQVDGSYELPSTAAKALAGSGAGTVYHGPSTQTVFIGATGPDSPLADRRIVDALSLVLDRQAIVRSVYDGAAEPLKTVIPPLVWQHGEASQVYADAYRALPDVQKPDLAKARQLVEQANPGRRTINVAMGAGDQQSLQILTLLQAGAKQIGLDVSIKQLQPTQMSGLFYDPSLRQGLDATMVLGYVQVPDPVSYVPLLTTPGSMFNWTGYRNPKVSELLAQAQGASDAADSAARFAAAQAIYTRDLALLTVAGPYERVFVNKRITGVPASFAYISMPWAAHLGGTS